MTALPIELPADSLRDFCVRNQVQRLSLFGSVLTSRFTPASDVDVLVEFEPGARPSLLSLAKMELELSTLLQRKVDLRLPAELSPYFRDQVLASAQPCYERA